MMNDFFFCHVIVMMAWPILNQGLSLAKNVEK